MDSMSYAQRRDEIRTYFDRTAIDAWKRFASDAPLSRIRATVRAGRDRMRATLLSYLPDDLTGWRILDAGCGAGHLSVELANRGADVTGVDLAADMITFARDTLPAVTGAGRVELHAGDMLADWGRFDAVCAMDSLIHYTAADAVAAINRLAGRTDRLMAVTIAPRTPLLSAMHTAGKLFPRSDRAPSIQPVATGAISRGLSAEWALRRSDVVSSGFYISRAMEVARR